jgi:hypothetical protein
MNKIYPSEDNALTTRDEVERVLRARTNFRAYADDISNSIQAALERRHLISLRLTDLPSPTLQSLLPEDLFLLRLHQIGYGPAMERSLDMLNMQNVLGTFRDGTHNLVVALSADGIRTHLYLGARSRRADGIPGHVSYDFVQSLRRTVEGNFPGTRFAADSRISAQSHEQEHWDIKNPLATYPYLATLTGIPSLRAERHDQFAQSMDRFAQAMQGQSYLLLTIAEPVSEPDVSLVLARCLQLGTEVHSWTRMGMNFAQAIGDSVNQARARGEVKSEADAKALAQSVAHGISRQPGAIAGGLLGSCVSLGLSSLLGPASLAVGSMTNTLAATLIGYRSRNWTDGETTTRSQTWSESLTESLTEGSSRTDTTSANVEILSKTAEHCGRLIEGYRQRFQSGQNLGMWSVGVYFLARDSVTFAQGQAQLRALYSGRGSYLEPIRTLDLSSPSTRSHMGAVLLTFNNPVLEVSDSTGQPLYHPLGPLHESLSTPINTEELSLLLNLPRREIPGLTLQMVADFGVNPEPLEPGRGLVLGQVVSGGKTLPIPVGLSQDALTRHTFITGLPGGGKTNTCFALLKSLGAQGIPFLVLEPAKGEYRSLLGDSDIPDLRVYTLGDERVAPFRINPFQFMPGMNLVTHLDNLKAIFNASFPMYAAMPYLLEEALIACYQERGWDLVYSTHRECDMDQVIAHWRSGEPDHSYTAYLPTLGDLMFQIDAVVAIKGYSMEVGQNYTAALKARINSLLLGSKGQMFNTRRGIGFDTLFTHPTVLEMRSIGDDDEKCFLMALLLVQLYEYREMQHRWDTSSGLRHLTVIEEAHRLLGRTAPGGSLEGANPRGKAVESFANILAEIREYGEGFLVVDQTPAKIIPDVLKNSSTKILHRLTARDDRDAMGDAMGMTEDQRQMVSHLRVGEAVFHTQDQDQPIWVRVEPVKGRRGTVSDDEVRDHMTAFPAEHTHTKLSDILARSAGLSERLIQLTETLNP